MLGGGRLAPWLLAEVVVRCVDIQPKRGKAQRPNKYNLCYGFNGLKIFLKHSKVLLGFVCGGVSAFHESVMP
jgi:hypothetical protein